MQVHFELIEGGEEKDQVRHRRELQFGRVWKSLVKFGRDKRVGKDNSRIAIKRRADLAQLTNMIEGAGTNGGNVSFEREIIVKDDCKVATG